MKRAVGLVFVLALAAGCASAHRDTTAPTTTTTATTTTAPVATNATASLTATTDSTTTTVAADQAFRTKVPGVLTVGTESVEPPWYIGGAPADITQGFEYDLAKALAARLRIPEVRVVQTNLTAMLGGEVPNCDLVLDEVTVTDERAKALDLSEPYLTVGQAVLVRTGTTLPPVANGDTFRWGTTVRDTAGVDVVTNRVHGTYPPDVVVDSADGIHRLTSGDIDAFVLDTPSAIAAADANPALTVAGQFRTNDQYAAALPLGSPNTVFLNDAIGAAVDDGTVGRLLQRYFGVDPAAVPSIPG